MSDFLSRLAGSALGGMMGRGGGGGLGGGLGGGVGGAVLGAVLGHLMNNQTGAGGLSGLADRFRGAGLGGHVDSWVSHGPNQAVAPHELERVFEPGQLDAWSQQTGVDRGGLLGMLSQALPGLVDGMTPHGRLPQHDHEVPQGEGLGGLLGGLFGGGGAIGGGELPQSGTTGDGIGAGLRGVGPMRNT
jgi:uncharacterized protein YidB (DUF937 family)